MKRIIAFMLVFSLLMPSLAEAVGLDDCMDNGDAIHKVSKDSDSKAKQTCSCCCVHQTFNEPVTGIQSFTRVEAGAEHEMMDENPIPLAYAPLLEPPSHA